MGPSLGRGARSPAPHGCVTRAMCPRSAPWNPARRPPRWLAAAAAARGVLFFAQARAVLPVPASSRPPALKLASAPSSSSSRLGQPHPHRALSRRAPRRFV
ncbi:hypothetical protein BDA96_10G269700 [Sorghum bicolor]|uniref:Uncharacterized protein n=1 Tax=Sorghum bicolor TaxID=4558 RepID=A0A921Q780_SORBI|nr:hypothetical protein BDA96_10G269700 [Sorghum bicolor]